MNWSKLNPYKIPIIAGSFALAFIVAVFSFFYGVKQATVENNAPVRLVSNQAVAVDLKIKGNKLSKIYHLRGCPNYDDIKESHIVWFKTKAEAESAGFRMAKNC